MPSADFEDLLSSQVLGNVCVHCSKSHSTLQCEHLGHRVCHHIHDPAEFTHTHTHTHTHTYHLMWRATVQEAYAINNDLHCICGYLLPI